MKTAGGFQGSKITINLGNHQILMDKIFWFLIRKVKIIIFIRLNTL